MTNVTKIFIIVASIILTWEPFCFGEETWETKLEEALSKDGPGNMVRLGELLAAFTATKKNEPVSQSVYYPLVKKHFPEPFLSNITLVYLDEIPLSDKFLSEKFGMPHPENLEGLTFSSIIFIKKQCAGVVFHELVHAMQFHLLGPEKFMVLYKILAEDGYDENPLEKMAYDLQDLFEKENLTENATSYISREVSSLEGLLPKA